MYQKNQALNSVEMRKFLHNLTYKTGIQKKGANKRLKKIESVAGNAIGGQGLFQYWWCRLAQH